VPADAGNRHRKPCLRRQAERIVEDHMILLRWAVFACGVALLAVTGVGAARAWTSTGLWILGILGVLCLLMALIEDKIRELVFEHGGTKVRVKLHDGLDNEVQADLDVTGLAGAAGIYSFVHNQLADDPSSYDVKVKLQDAVVATVKKNAFNQPVDSKEVDEVLSSGSAAERVLVFGLLEGDAGLATVERLHQGISKSKSGNEQYHALRATWEHWDAFSEAEQEQLRKYVRDAYTPYIDKDPDRKKIADKILATGR
jgi:hypothetical protein